MRSRIEPLKKVAGTLRAHEPLLLNWFRARKRISSGPTEGMNNRLQLTLRKAYGFRDLAGLGLVGGGTARSQGGIDPLSWSCPTVYLQCDSRPCRAARR